METPSVQSISAAASVCWSCNDAGYVADGNDGAACQECNTAPVVEARL